MDRSTTMDSPQIIEIPFKSVNCYLLRSTLGFILVDTGTTKNRHELEAILAEYGITPQNQKLILVILTHGDFDHSGNAAYIHETYKVPVAIHAADVGMVERGDISWNRNMSPLLKLIAKGLTYILGLQLKKPDRFSPAIKIQDGQDLKDYGVEGNIIELPGHSKGSIGILLNNDSLICGDLFQNRKKPEVADMVSDRKALNESVGQVQEINPLYVFPGHGTMFKWEEFTS